MAKVKYRMLSYCPKFIVVPKTGRGEEGRSQEGRGRVGVGEYSGESRAGREELRGSKREG